MMKSVVLTPVVHFYNALFIVACTDIVEAALLDYFQQNSCFALAKMFVVAAYWHAADSVVDDNLREIGS